MPEIQDLPKELIDEIRTTFKIFDQDDGKPLILECTDHLTFIIFRW